LRSPRGARATLADLDPLLDREFMGMDENDPHETALFLAFAATSNDKRFEIQVLYRQRQLVIPVEPDRVTERLSVQQGTFLCPGDPEISFMDI
jgi:hypothetical protein